MKTEKWIRDRRAATGLSQAALAQKVGVTQPIVSQWERGLAAPSLVALEKLRAVLGETAGSSALAAPVRRGRPASSKPASVPESPESGPVPTEPGRARGRKAGKAASSANLGFEDKLWAAADKLRGHMDASEYKHVVLGLIFLKYISDAFEEHRAALERDPEADPEARDEYIAENVFWPRRLRQRSKDILGRVYEYFLGKFAAAEGKSGGEFYTPQGIVKLLVEMLEPFRGRVFDPCCGSGGMFVSSERFVEEHGGRRADLSIYGQESNSTTWRLARMNLAIRGIDANLGPEHADSFHRDLHAGLRE